MKPNRLIVPILVALSACGCASYTQSKIDLTAQAQQGVDRLREAIAARADEQQTATQQLRQRLDVAFDQDVTSRPDGGLSADWVIEHRKAYAAAIDVFDAQHRAAAASAQAMLDTCDAVTLALAQLQQMHDAELRLTLPEVKR